MEHCISPKSSRNHDCCDRKSLNNLMETIKKLQNSTSKEKGKPKVDSSKDNLKTTPKRKRRGKPVEQPLKITSWLNTENAREKRTKIENQKIESKLTPLDITLNNDQSDCSKTALETTAVEILDKTASDHKKFDKYKDKKLFDVMANDTWDRPQPTVPKATKSKSSKSKTLKRNPSFEKYGIVMPTFEKIVSDQKKFDEYKDSVKRLEVFDDDILNKSLVVDCLTNAEEFQGELLDCKHLSLEELDDAFKKNLTTLSGIIKGEKYSKRHHWFHQLPISKHLRCSASLVVFTQEQKDHLLDLMRKEFDPEDKMTKYFFLVLLPELCLRVFMDVHQMAKKKATAYLEKRPLDI